MDNEMNASGSAVAETQPDLAGLDAAGGVFDQDRYLLHQKHFAISEKYRLFDATGRTLLYVKREAAILRQLLAFAGAIVAFLIVGGGIVAIGIATDMVAIAIGGLILGTVAAVVAAAALSKKRHIHFCVDETMQQGVLRVFQDQKFVLFNATYTVADDDFNFIGLCRKNYLDNILRKRWFVYGEGGELTCIVKEDSLFKAIFRRVGPLAGLMRTNFIFFGPDGRTVLGAYNRKFTVLDKYVLDMSQDAQRSLDRRLAVAMAVLLDTGEKR